MKRISWIFCASLVACAAVVTAPASRASADISFGISAPIGDDGNLFFSISSRYFDRDTRVVSDWGRRFRDPDDLAVFLYLSSRTRVAPEVIYKYRAMGTSWYDVGVRVGVPVDVWYVPVERDPGPPYGKAYGHWKRHQADPSYRVRLSDRQCRDLVAVRMAHEYYGVAPEVAMDWRHSGSDVRTIMTREYRNRHHDGGRDDDRNGRGKDKKHGRDDRHDDHGHDHGGN